MPPGCLECFIEHVLGNEITMHESIRTEAKVEET
jgi:hypothetical protein